MKEAFALSLVLVLVSNGMALVINETGIDRPLVYLAWALVLLLAVLWWARGPGGMSWTEMAVSGSDWRKSAAFGIVIGLGLAVALIVSMTFPFLLAGPIRYQEIEKLDALGLLWRVGVELTIATVLTEEILFRGILQALFMRSLSTNKALVSTSVVFALWHLTANALSVQQNAVALPLIPTAAAQVIGYLGSLVAVGIGGFLLSVLREQTNHLAGSVALHWVAVAGMTLLIYFR